MSGCGREAVAPHRGGEFAGIGRAAGGSLNDRGDVPEVVRTEDAGADDTKRGGVHVAVVVEAVNSAAGDADDLPARARGSLHVFVGCVKAVEMGGAADRDE